jgi:uncharacterized protein
MSRQTLYALVLVFTSLFVLPENILAQVPTLPPAPDRYITDQAGVLDRSTLSTVNAQLALFDKATSNQVVVAVYSSLPPDVQIDTYCTDTFNAWGVGQKGKNNGVVLFVFIADHKLMIRTGTGLEKALSNESCKSIVTQLIVPQFKQGNYAGGVRAGVNAIIDDLTKATLKGGSL